MCPSLIERSFTGLNNMWRRIEIWLADLEVNHTLTLRFQRASLHQHFKRSFDQDAVHPRSKFHCLFRKKGTPLRSSARKTASSMDTGSPETRPVTRVPSSSVTMIS